MSFIETISGGSISYNLRHRVFNLFVFFGATAALFDILIKSWFSLSHNKVTLSLLILGVFIVTFYIVRILGVFSNAIIIISAVLVLAILGFSFFYNAGMQGKVIPLLIFSLTIYFLSSKGLITYIVSFLHIFSVILILILNYYYPEWVVHYSNTKEELIDNVANVVYIILIMYFILSLIRNELEREHQSVRNKDSYLNHQNQLIESLLGELNHRVKNNLQVVSALLSLQAYRSDNLQVIEALEEGRNRLAPMSILHKKLYQDSFFNQISLSEYIDDLVEQALLKVDESFEIEKDVQNIVLTVDQAMPLGLILNEIFTNLCKGIFESEETIYSIMKIQALLNEDSVQISIDIGGKVDSREVFLIQESEFNIKLIEMFVKQLDGSFSLITNELSGTEIIIKFILEY